MVLNITRTIVIMLKSLTFLVGIMDRECETTFVVPVDLWKNTWVLCVNLCNPVCPLWWEGPSQWPSGAIPQFPIGHGGCSSHSFSRCQTAQPLQTGLHDQQVPDFLSWHTKCSSEQTRETRLFGFVWIAVELIWVGVSLGGVLKTSLPLTQDCSIFSKQQEGYNRYYLYSTCRAQILVQIRL